MLVGLFSHFVEAGQKSFKGKIIEGYNFSFSHTQMKSQGSKGTHSIFPGDLLLKSKPEFRSWGFQLISNEGCFPGWSWSWARKHLTVLNRNLGWHAWSGAKHLLLLWKGREGYCQGCSKPQSLAVWRPGRTHSELSVPILYGPYHNQLVN